VKENMFFSTSIGGFRTREARLKESGLPESKRGKETGGSMNSMRLSRAHSRERKWRLRLMVPQMSRATTTMSGIEKSDLFIIINQIINQQDRSLRRDD
jgi:hypothetical protein